MIHYYSHLENKSVISSKITIAFDAVSLHGEDKSTSNGEDKSPEM